MADFKEIDDLLQSLIGEVVWSVQRGIGTYLTMEFGEPHRFIREPRQASEDASSRVRKIYARRLVTIRGDLSLFITDSQWSIFTKDASVNWESNEKLVEEMIGGHLDGQRVISASRRADDTILEFDLGTTVRLGKSIFPNDMGSMLWSIARWGSTDIGLLNSGAVAGPDWKYGDEDEIDP